jgi:hypothetical protein
MLRSSREESSMLKFLALAAALFGVCTAPAYAYLDPTTGSILLQGLFAGVAGVMVIGRLYWTRMKAFLRRLTGKHIAGS